MDLAELLFNAGVGAILIAVKNPQQRLVARRAFLKLFKAIWDAFANDPEFREVVGVE